MKYLITSGSSFAPLASLDPQSLRRFGVLRTLPQTAPLNRAAVPSVSCIPMKEITKVQLRNELLNLDGSNGWGVDFKPDVCIHRKKLVAEIVSLVEEYGAYPVDQTLDSDYDTIIVKNPGGSFTFGIRLEVSMLNYQKFEESGEPLLSYAAQLSKYFFNKHLNKIKVLW